MSQGSRAEKEQKRHAVAFARLAGQGTRATARQIGCSERYVRRLAAEPETQFLITETLRPHIAKLLQLMPKALAVIEEAMSAMKKDEPTVPSRAVEDAAGLSVVIRRVFTRGAHAKRLAPTAHCRAPRSPRSEEHTSELQSLRH